MKDDRVYLRHILDAILKIESYLKGVSYENFSANNMMIDAVIRELEIVGEVSKNVSMKFRMDHVDIPWSKIMGMRNYLIHEYFGVNKKIVWETCETDLGQLKQQIKKLL